MKKNAIHKLQELGVWGFDKVEPVILAALVTEDPLLIIGPSGTGKTYLLNSLSEALGLEHRHYNASLISFDDLVGFPFPDQANESLKFLETPATVWGAESVLIDEISRCKPEHQNRLFSIIYERRLQGIQLKKLRYRWAAMNPCNLDQSSTESYSGSEPLDPALADRFSLFITSVDWTEFTEEEKKAISDPGGEGAPSNDNGELSCQLKKWREQFIVETRDPPDSELIDYVISAATLFNNALIRISPRRSRLLARALLAASIVTGGHTSKTYQLVLSCSLPQITWGENIPSTRIEAIHRSAWQNSKADKKDKWVFKFHLVDSLPGKIKLLLENCPDQDSGTLAVEQLLANESRARSAIFAYSVYPAALLEKINIGAEALNDLGKIAGQMYHIDTKISWQERVSSHQSHHPEIIAYQQIMEKFHGERLEHARQFFMWCVVNNIVVDNPESLEKELNECINLLKG